jgi:hypothetical protein
MIHWFLDVLRHHPEVTFCLVLGIGYVLGKLKLGSFTLGAVTGTLLAGVIVGQLGVKVSGEVKQCFRRQPGARRRRWAMASRMPSATCCSRCGAR